MPPFSKLINNVNNKMYKYNNNTDNKTNNNKIISIITYADLDKNKYAIYENSRNKSGIYRWNNLITGRSYVGSAVNLTRRLGNYFSSSFLKKELSKHKSIISSSLLKHGYSNFSLDILEYCEPSLCISREQYYFNLLKPEYNILKTAGSRLGIKHSAETLLKFKNRKLSPEALANLKKSKEGVIPTSALRKTNHLLATGHITRVVNKQNNSVKIYDSIRAAARDLGVKHSTLLYYIDTSKLYKGIYIITRKKQL